MKSWNKICFSFCCRCGNVENRRKVNLTWYDKDGNSIKAETHLYYAHIIGILRGIYKLFPSFSGYVKTMHAWNISQVAQNQSKLRRSFAYSCRFCMWDISHMKTRELSEDSNYKIIILFLLHISPTTVILNLNNHSTW